MKITITLLLILFNISNIDIINKNTIQHSKLDLLDEILIDNKTYQKYIYNKKDQLKIIKTINPNVWKKKISKKDSILFVEDIYTKPYSINYKYDKKERIKSITFKDDQTNKTFRNEIFKYDSSDNIISVNEFIRADVLISFNHSQRLYTLLGDLDWQEHESEISIDYSNKKTIYLKRKDSVFNSILYLDKDNSIYKEENYNEIGLRQTLYYEYYDFKNKNHIQENPVKPFTKHIKSISYSNSFSDRIINRYRFDLEFDSKDRLATKRIARIMLNASIDTIKKIEHINEFKYIYK